MSQWNWCADNCKSADGVGDSVRLTIEMINQATETSSETETTETTTTAATSNSTNSSRRRLQGCTGGSCENGAVEDLGGVYLSVLNTYSIQAQDGSMKQYTLPKNPSLTIDPPAGTQGASKRTTTLVLEFPRVNFTANDTLIYDPLLSYSDISEDGEDGGDDGTATTTAEDASTTVEDISHGGRVYLTFASAALLLSAGLY